jgi:uncharacterized protein YfaS (alpha-2-macroglobulin family)
VLRHSPDGAVAWAKSISLTFSEPMLALGAVNDMAGVKLPLRMTPDVKGRWRWIGTQSLLFEPDDGRLAQATRYEITLTANTRSDAGASLGKDAHFSFSTAAPELVAHYPSDPVQALRPVLIATFNQAVDSDGVIPLIEFRAGTSKLAAVAATERAITDNAQLFAVTQQLPKQHWVAFTPVSDLPKDSSVSVHLSKGVPAVEGPLRSTNDEAFEFRTFAPLTVTGIECGSGDPCLPRSPIVVEFSNRLDPRSFDPKLVSISPSVGNLRVEITERDQIVLYGPTRGNTEYTVSIAPGVRDKFGQTLASGAQQQIRVARVKPRVFPEVRHSIVVDPARPPTYSVYSVNVARVQVKAYRVNAEDYPQFIAQLRPKANTPVTSYGMPKVKPFGTLAIDTTLTPEPVADELVETKVDLGPALSSGLGHVLLVINDDSTVWVQSTRIGIDAHWDHTDLFGWTTSLLDNTTLVGTALSVVPGGNQALTDVNGIARVPLTKRGSFILAKHGADTAVLDKFYRYGPVSDPGNGFATTRPSNDVRWFEFDDRHLYRPGETLQLKGWVRQLSQRKAAQLEQLPNIAKQTLGWRAVDAEDIELAKGKLTLDEMGGYDLSVVIPKTANLGYGNIYFDAIRGTPDHSFQFRIEEFRRPEFELKLDVSGAPHLVGSHAIATLGARYFSGGGMSAAQAEWRVNSQPARYSPPHWREFRFGWQSRPDFSLALGMDYAVKARGAPGGTPLPASGRWFSNTGKDGQHRLRIDFDALDPAVTRTVQVSAEVTDSNRQKQVASSRLIVHPASNYVGLRPRSLHVSAGSAIELDVVVTDIDGRVVAGRPVTLVAERVECATVPGSPECDDHRVEASRVAMTSGSQPGVARLNTREAGEYVIAAVVTDNVGRKSRSETSVWVGGNEVLADPKANATAVTLIADQAEYRVGETARLLVLAPFAPFKGLVTVNRNGILSATAVASEERSTFVEVPVTAEQIPQAKLCVDLVGRAVSRAANRDAEATASAAQPPMPTHSTNCIQLNVPPRDRTLAIELSPQASESQPSARATIRVSVRHPDGKPTAGAQVALAVVDEAVLSLKEPVFYKDEYFSLVDVQPQASERYAPDPIAYFYGEPHPVTHTTVTNWTLQQDVPAGATLFEAENAPAQRRHGAPRRMGTGLASLSSESKATAKLVTLGSVAEFGSSRGDPAPPSLQTQLALRRHYTPLAAYYPKLSTDRDGLARVNFTLPDSLTRYRVMAVAAAGDNRFGSAETTLTTDLPLTVRASPPRFLNQGDRAALPVVLNNRASVARSVEVAARGCRLAWVGPQALRVTVPANGRAQVAFQARAAQSGTARFQVVAVTASGDEPRTDTATGDEPRTNTATGDEHRTGTATSDEPRTGTGAGKPADHGVHTDNADSDASEHEFPVHRPRTTEVTATYGKLDRGALRLQLARPRSAEPDVGELELSIARSAIQNLSDALHAVLDASYGDNEQLASQLHAGTVLDTSMRRFIDAKAAQALATNTRQSQSQLLINSQMGTWSDWGNAGPVAPFLSIYATHALVRNKAVKGSEAYEQALDMLRDPKQRFDDVLPEDLAPTLQAYALHVLSAAGERDAARTKQLLTDAGGLRKLPITAVAWLLPVLQRQPELSAELADARRIIQNSCTETAGAAHVNGSELDVDYRLLGSAQRTEAIVLDALIEDQPQSTLLPKLAAGLLAARVNGQWRTTQENAWAIVALSHYAKVVEKPPAQAGAAAGAGARGAAAGQLGGASSGVRAWLADRYQTEARGNAAAFSTSQLPMERLLELPETTDLVLANATNAPIYYRLGLAYAPRDARIAPSEQGFAVSRVIEPLEDASDVTRDAAGRWHVRAGAAVRIRVAVSTRDVRHQVAVVDPLAAGLEIVNEAVTPVPLGIEAWRKQREATARIARARERMERIRQARVKDAQVGVGADVKGARSHEASVDGGTEDDWEYVWDHTNLRDDRVELFASELPEGVHSYSYFARATTKGQFALPPCQAHERYAPEVFGRTEGGELVIE